MEIIILIELDRTSTREISKIITSVGLKLKLAPSLIISRVCVAVRALVQVAPRATIQSSEINKYTKCSQWDD
jgi:hypothetical protein